MYEGFWLFIWADSGSLLFFKLILLKVNKHSISFVASAEHSVLCLMYFVTAGLYVDCDTGSFQNCEVRGFCCGGRILLLSPNSIGINSGFLHFQIALDHQIDISQALAPSREHIYNPYGKKDNTNWILYTYKVFIAKHNPARDAPSRDYVSRDEELSHQFDIVSVSDFSEQCFCLLSVITVRPQRRV